jgi:hypothetical protein
MRKILFILTAILLTGTLLYAQAPVINSFSPVTGYVGSTVTITGANFNGTSPANNQVFFGSAQATVLTSSFGTLTVSVPAGSTTGLISVRNAATGLTGYSRNHFNGLFCNTPLTGTSYAPFNTATGDQEITGINGAYNIDIYDIDGDGKSDIITGHQSNGFTIARNNSSLGTMNFVATNIPTSAAVQQFVVADFDGDGKRDIAISGSGGAWLFRNLSTPGNISFAARVTLATGNFYQCAAGDIDNDGKIDFVGGSGNSIITYRNTSSGPGNFSFTVNTAVAVGSNSNGIQCVDVDGDGKADIVGTQRSANRIYALRNTSTTSTFSFAALQTFSTVNAGPYRLKMADFDKDGKIDFVMPLYEGAKTCIFKNTSTVGTINFATPLNLLASTQNYRVGVGDVNGDGLPDVVTKPNGIGTIFQVFLNTSTGPGVVSFNPFIQYNSAAGSEVGGIAIGDMDGDLVPDIATSGISSNKIRFHRNKGAQIDATPPNANCKNIIVALSPFGTVSVTGAMIDNGSSDACGLKPFLINGQPSVTFTCNNIGPNTVTLTVTDLANNTTTCNAVVTVAPAAIIVSGQTTVCQGQTVTLTANQGDSYQWLKDNNVIAGANSQTFVATETGNYSVTVTNAGGCSGTSTPTAITVNNNPTVAITPSGNASLCPPNGSVQISATTSSIYQWKKEGVNIPGATQQNYTATTTGNYSVQVIDLFGCSATSSPVAISATDNIAPVAKCKNISVIIDANGNASITAADINDGSTDNCGIASVDISGQSSYSCADVGKTIPVTLTVKDNSNNVSTCEAQVTVTDPNMVCNTPPVAVCKALVISANSGCQGLASAEDFNNGSTDANGDALTYSILPAGPYALGTTNVALTVTDSKGASSTCNTTITVEDKTAPMLVGTAPENATVSCNNIPPAPAVTAIDNCDANPIVSLNGVSTKGNDASHGDFYNYTITRTWKAKDAANNEAVIATQVITVEDKSAPVISCPANATVNCQDGTASMTTGMATATDNCSPVVITETETSTQNSDPASSGHYNYTITRTWKATDVSGSFSECVQTIIVQDVTAPTITVPANATVNCQDDTAPSALGSAAGSDNCSTVSISYTDVPTKHADANNAAYYNYTITRTWKVTDASGNATTGNQVITVQDVTKPALVIPSTVTVNCQDDKSSGATGTATGSDNCSPVNITQSDASTQNPDPNNAGHYNFTISRTWTATDISGNSESAIQLITVQDVTKPVITIPANVTINCQDDNSSLATGVATGTDNCSAVAISQTQTSTQNSNVNNAGHYNYIITRTWTATDATGNNISGNQTITVQDVTAPVVKVKNVTVTLVNGVASISPAMVNDGCADNCSPLNFTLSKTTFNCFNIGQNTVTLTVTDVSGNTASANAVVTVLGVIPAPAITVSRTNNTFTGAGTEKTIFLGYGAQSLNLSATNGTSTQANTTYAWSPATFLSTTHGAATVYSPNASAQGDKNIMVTATNEFGCVKAETVTIKVVDARCGNNLDKVNVCHVGHGNLLHENTICISASAVATHLNAGCTLNECGSNAPTSVNGRIAGNSQNANSSVSGVDLLTINVAPNPTTRHFRISVESSNTAKPAQVRVYNLNGKTLETKQNVPINTVFEIGANYIPGVYMVEVWQGNQRRQLKLIKLAE